MNKVEVGRALGGAYLLVWTVLLGALSGCGEATCPKGSLSMGGKCVPANRAACKDGEERVEGVCMSTSGVAGDDGGSAGGSGRAGQGGSSGTRGEAGRPAADAGGMDSGSTTVPGEDAAVPPDGGATPEEDGGADAAPDAGAPPDAGPEPDPDPASPCFGFACGAHGRCEVVAEAPECTCDAGYIGDRCDRCEPGLALKGSECVPLCEADSAPNCGAHGACMVNAGITSCSCTHPWIGEHCAECARGFSLQSDGSCKADCGGSCPAHGFCDDAKMFPECACYTGYVLENSSCIWRGDGRTGGIVDGELTSGAAWNPEHVSFSGGNAVFQATGSNLDCKLGSVAQTLKMPTRAQAEPLVLEFETVTQCTDPAPYGCPGLLVEMGGGVTRVEVPGKPGGETRYHKLCLGAGAYATPSTGDVLLRVRPSIGGSPLQAPFDCETPSWPQLRYLKIRPAAAADRCPAPDGTLSQSSFSATGEWVLTGGAVVQQEALHMPAASTATQQVMVPAPDDDDFDSLGYVFSQASGGQVRVEVDGVVTASTDTGAGEWLVCMPPWSMGGEHKLTLVALGDVVLSELTPVWTSSCGGGRFDSGFERPPLGTSGWMNFPSSAGGASPAHDESNPGSGRRSLRLDSTKFLSASVWLPVRTADAAPALEFSYMTGTAGQSMIPVGIVPGLAQTVPLTSTRWEKRVRCLEPIWEGQVFFSVVQLTRATDPIWIDDFGFFNNSDCAPW